MKRILLTLVTVLLSTFCVPTNQANAQSIPILTDPIKVREVELMSNRLDMTTAQQEALLGLYDMYIEDFARVKSGEIKDFEDDIAEAAETFGFMRFQIPEREMVEGLIRKAQRAIRAIHRSDNLFFDEVLGMLTEKQQLDLKRIQIARELEAYQLFVVEMFGGLNRGARAQLRSLYSQLDTESNVEIDELLDTYDQRYLTEVKEGFETIIVTLRLLLNQIDELNVRGMDQQALMMRFMADPDAIEDLKKRGEIILKPLADQAFEISQLNWKTWSRLDSLLETEDAYKLREWYFGKSFREAVRGGSKVDLSLSAVIGLNTISEGQRIDLQNLQQSFQTKWSSMTEKHAELLEKSRKIQTVAIMSGDMPSGFEDQLSSLNSTRREYLGKMEERIDSILGKELAKKIRGGESTAPNFSSSMMRGMPIDGDSNGSVTVSSDGSSTEVQVVIGSTEGVELSEEEMQAIIAEAESNGELVIIDAGDAGKGPAVVTGEAIHISQADIDFDSITATSDEKQKLYGSATIPKPLSPSFPKRAAVVLELDDTGVIIIEAVYTEYREKYDEAYQAIADGSKEIYEDKELGGGERMRDTNAISKTAADSVASLDATFFDDLVAVTALARDDVNVKMLADHRNRQRLSAPDDPWGWRGGEGDTIDLVGLYVMSKDSNALHEGISMESKVAIRKAMQGYNEQVARQHEQFVNATYDLAHLRDAMWLMNESNASSKAAESVQGRWREAFTRVRDSKRALLLANQTVMEGLLNDVPQTDFWKVRMEFVQKAYPDVFKKGTDITQMLTAATAIPSLDPTQKSTLDTLASNYRYDFWNLCEAMIKNHQSNATASSSEGFVGKEDVHRQLQLETLRFQRRELNDRMQMRLRMVLNDEQIKDVPGLRPIAATGKDWKW